MWRIQTFIWILPVLHDQFKSEKFSANAQWKDQPTSDVSSLYLLDQTVKIAT